MEDKRNLSFKEGRGRKVISFIGGKVVLIANHHKGTFPLPGEVWEVRNVNDCGRFYTVVPVRRIKTKEENEEEIRERQEEAKKIKEEERNREKEKEEAQKLERHKEWVIETRKVNRANRKVEKEWKEKNRAREVEEEAEREKARKEGRKQIVLFMGFGKENYGMWNWKESSAAVALIREYPDCCIYPCNLHGVQYPVWDLPEFAKKADIFAVTSTREAAWDVYQYAHSGDIGKEVLVWSHKNQRWGVGPKMGTGGKYRGVKYTFTYYREKWVRGCDAYHGIGFETCGSVYEYDPTHPEAPKKIIDYKLNEIKDELVRWDNKENKIWELSYLDYTVRERKIICFVRATERALRTIQYNILFPGIKTFFSYKEGGSENEKPLNLKEAIEKIREVKE